VQPLSSRKIYLNKNKEIGGVLMKRKFISKMISLTMISAILYNLVPVKASAEWRNDYQGNWYYMQGSEKLTGWKKIDGQLYYFDDNGKMLTGWIKAGDSWYFLQNNGALKIGWINYNNNWYFADSNGAIQTGALEILGKIYIFDTNGVMETSNTIINGQFYTIDSDGAVAGFVAPTPAREYDINGNCLSVIQNAATNAATSPIQSQYDNTIKDQSDSNGESDDYLIKYTVTFRDSNGDVLKTETVSKGRSVDLYQPSKAGYTFVEWNVRSDGTGKSYADNDTVKIIKDLTLYAQWKMYVTSISINGNSSVAVNNTAEMTATVSPSNADNTSVTWSVTPGTGNATINSNGVLTGVSSGTITVTATANDGSGVSATKQVTVE
jgi:uncharacterized repeat protein (TIGR02543 family)